jgi:hypothetical protein
VEDVHQNQSELAARTAHGELDVANDGIGAKEEEG